MKISSKKCKFEAKLIFLELANFVLKQILKFLSASEVVSSLVEERNDLNGKQKVQNVLQIKIRELQKDNFCIKFLIFR